MLAKLLIFWLFQHQLHELCALQSEFMIESESLPADLNYMPSLSNGQLGYTVYGDAIFMNGLYNGHIGDSRRARIPNWLNFSVSVEQAGQALQVAAGATTVYQLNVQDGYFRWRQSFASAGLTLRQRTYPHRFYNRALIYELCVQRSQANEPLELRLTQIAGAASNALDFAPLSGKAGIKMLKGTTRVVEQEEFQSQRRTIFIAFSEDVQGEKILRMAAGETQLYYRYIVTVDEEEAVAEREMKDVLALEPCELLRTHTTAWRNFWQDFNITISGNLELSQVINAGIFYLASALPSARSNQDNPPFYGLSPTGLARGQLDDDYEGHNFWDTEIWMLPVVLQFSTEWTQQLFLYRLQHLSGAQFNALATGYKGARFPWESAYTGIEVINPCCPEVAEQQIHISADIAFALQQYYAASNEREWLCQIAWPLLRDIAAYLESRVVWNEQTQKYHVQNVMGPDEDHERVNDSVYTNVQFKIALEFASYTQQTCEPNESAQPSETWLHIAQHLHVLYDAQLDYHPEFSGYQVNETVKQADVILLAYPLQYKMNASTRLNDLHSYEHATRSSGPAMTWSMFAINFLDAAEFSKADYYFTKAYKDYVHGEFKVWSETKIGNVGAANFLTGVGGMLQAVLYGYGGLRLHREGHTSVMEIRPSRPLPGTSEMLIQGIKFAHATFALAIKGNGSAVLTCVEVGSTKMELLKQAEHFQVYKGFTIGLDAASVFLRTLSSD